MKTKIWVISCVTLLAALFINQAVFADGEPPVGTEDPAEQPASDDTVTAPEPADEPANDPPAEALIPDVANSEDGSLELVPDEPVIIDAAEADPSIEGAPEEPQIVILDENGSAVDMASVESAGIISSADPYYKVGSVFYRFLVDCSGFWPNTSTSICVQDPNPIQAAIDDIRTNNRMPSDGKIYVEKDTYSDTVLVDAATYSFLAAFKGLVGKTDENGVFPTITGSVTVIGTTKGFTLSGFTITNSVIFEDNLGTLLLQDLVVEDSAGDGLDVKNHTGSVSMIRVKAKDNENKGAEIDNKNSGSVTIKDSEFTGNGSGISTSGLKILTNGAVTIDGLSVSSNYIHGLWIEGFSKLTIKNAVFYKNIQDGANLLSTKPAPVILENIHAYENYLSGVRLRTDGGSVTIKNIQASLNKGGAGLLISNSLGTTSPAVSITNGHFNDNNGDGFAIASKGNVILTNVSATDNSARGVTIQNYEGAGNVTIKSLLIGDYYDFSRNGNIGIDIQTSGIVLVSNVFANNCGSSGMSVVATTAAYDKSVTISRAWFNDNQGGGLGVSAKGTITVTDVSASGNMEHSGISLHNTSGKGNVVLKSSSASAVMHFDDNRWNGIRIETNGSVLVSNVSARRNGPLGQYGIDIWNRDGDTANTPKPVTLTRAEVHFNGASGLNLFSEGLVTLTDVSVSDNGTSGSGFDGTYISTLGSVTIKTSSSSRFAEFSRNPAVGLQIIANGTVTLSNLIANDNGFIAGYGTDGIVIDNRAAYGNILVTNVSACGNGQATTGSGLKIVHEVPGLGGSVTVKSSSSSAYYAFDDNSGYGLVVESQGAVSVSNVLTKLGNGFSGIFIDNQTLQNNRPIIVARALLEGNTEKGLEILANGAVTLESIEAWDNGLQGVAVDACWYDSIYCRANGIVTLKGLRNVFSDNRDAGLEITAGGNVILANFIAEENDGAGVSVANDIGVSTGSVQVSAGGSTLNMLINNGIVDLVGGMHISSNGAITVSRVLAEGSGLYGIQLKNNTSLTKAGVTVSSVYANRNTQDGLVIQTLGNIQLNNIQAVFNDLNRADANYFSGVTINYGLLADPGNLTIAGTNYLANNSLYGLNARAGGVVSLTGVVLDTNGNSTSGGGMYLDAKGAGKTVLLSNVTAVNNYLNGVHVVTQGTLTIKGSRFLMNGNNGAKVETNGNSLIVQSNYFTRNTLYGLMVNSTPSSFKNLSNVYLANLSGKWLLP